MGRHDHIGMDPQAFVSYAKLEAVCDDRTGTFINRDRKSFHHSKRHIIAPSASDDAIMFHAGSVEDLRSAEDCFSWNALRFG
jgi:hypothetical protein